MSNTLLQFLFRRYEKLRNKEMMPVTTPHCQHVAALCFLWTLGRAEPSPSWWGGIAPGSERSWALVCVWSGAPLSVSDSWLCPLQVSQQKVMPVPQEGWEPPSTNGTSNTVNERARYLVVPFPWKKSVLCREPLQLGPPPPQPLELVPPGAEVPVYCKEVRSWSSFLQS